jgi:mannose-6-phosphate isomerase-like protein (cupin superfamily)
MRVGHEMQLVRLADVEREVPAGHWGVASQLVERAGERLTVQVCEMATDGGAEPHTHEAHDQMFLVLDGALVVRDGGDRELEVRSGEAVQIPAGAVHATVNRGDGPANYVVLTYPAVQ